VDQAKTKTEAFGFKTKRFKVDPPLSDFICGKKLCLLLSEKALVLSSLSL